MKAINVSPNTVTYNTLINGYSQVGNSEVGGSLYEEMARNEVKADVLTYNALILGLCKEGQCVRRNSDRAFQLYKIMVRSGCHPNEHTFRMLISTFCKNEDFDGALRVLEEMIESAIPPDLSILSEIYDRLCLCGKDELAMKLCSKMEARCLMPKGFDKMRTSAQDQINENKEVMRNCEAVSTFPTTHSFGLSAMLAGI
ncbi:pentatricopeptide repeat-containing protein At4g26680, mitochondrial-like [Tripterygium wilfordii]|uniref:pentatricopeptide repeat-containing protein At4g26680, mitochondrial-like n=1 Tax=Tripterygium wilfordii TaxID=458696 RepID=UPI0018F82D43|nr:pentatricopeptide repeat-containing protein At4g26680, mitochondrial-like [Tripterygium wilfordii]